MPFPTVQQLFDLTGQVALVTGGARNLGLDMATALAEAGADVAITSRNLASAQQSAAQIARDTRRKVMGLACDVRFEDQVTATVDAVLADRSLVARVDDSSRFFELELAPGGDTQVLLRRLVDAGAAIQRFERIQPSLHQIFLQKVGASGIETGMTGQG